MVRIKNIFVLFIMVFAVEGSAQYVLTLDSCINQANRNFQFNQEIEYNAQIAELNIKNLNKGYLPSLELNAVSTYQNEQIEIPVALPGLDAPVAPLNLNNALVTMRQWIFDGSLTQHKKVIETANGNIRMQEVEVQKLNVKTKITQVYFGILLKQTQQQILRDKQAMLQSRLSEVSTAVENGLLLESDKNLLKAESVQLKQQTTELEFSLMESIKSLENLLGIPIPKGTLFNAVPTDIRFESSLSNRPDMLLLDHQSYLLEAQKELTKSVYLPKIGLFADGGIGLPGYNIFNDNLAPMARVGVTLRWKMFDWNQGRVLRQNLSINQKIIDLKKVQLSSQIGVQTAAQLNTIEKVKTLMQDDAELVSLYKLVADAYAAQLKNGTITSAEYIAQLNKVEEAESNLELHKIQLQVAILNYNNLLGE